MGGVKRFQIIQMEIAEKLGFQQSPVALTLDYASTWVMHNEYDVYKLIWDHVGIEGPAEWAKLVKRVKEVEAQVREPIAEIVSKIIKHTGVIPCQPLLLHDIYELSPEELASLAKLDGEELAQHVTMERHENCWCS